MRQNYRKSFINYDDTVDDGRWLLYLLTMMMIKDKVWNTMESGTWNKNQNRGGKIIPWWILDDAESL